MNTRVANLSLGHLGSSYEIANLDTERSLEARTARKFYDISLEETLRDCALPVTRRRAKLAVVSENPQSEYYYAYRVPPQCLAVRGLALPQVAAYYSNGLLLPLYKMSSDDSGALILSNVNNLEIEYIALVTNPVILPSDFIMAWSFKLAFYMAPQLTGGDKFKLQQTTSTAYLTWVDKAKVNAYNEEPGLPAPESEFVNAHFYSVDFGGYPISGRVS